MSGKNERLTEGDCSPIRPFTQADFRGPDGFFDGAWEQPLVGLDPHKQNLVRRNRLDAIWNCFPKSADDTEWSLGTDHNMVPVCVRVYGRADYDTAHGNLMPLMEAMQRASIPDLWIVSTPDYAHLSRLSDTLLQEFPGINARVLTKGNNKFLQPDGEYNSYTFAGLPTLESLGYRHWHNPAFTPAHHVRRHWMTLSQDLHGYMEFYALMSKVAGVHPDVISVGMMIDRVHNMANVKKIVSSRGPGLNWNTYSHFGHNNAGTMRRTVPFWRNDRDWRRVLFPRFTDGRHAGLPHEMMGSNGIIFKVGGNEDIALQYIQLSGGDPLIAVNAMIVPSDASLRTLSQGVEVTGDPAKTRRRDAVTLEFLRYIAHITRTPMEILISRVEEHVRNGVIWILEGETDRDVVTYVMPGREDRTRITCSWAEFHDYIENLQTERLENYPN